jgi:serine/threonine protein phosphatase 1
MRPAPDEGKRSMTDSVPASRTIAIGDVHGCLTAFNALLEAIEWRPDDLLVTLGDYVDRGPDSRGVLDRLIELRSQRRMVNLLGNHDAQMLAAVADPNEMHRWLSFGGLATLYSYSETLRLDAAPAAHLEFLRSCLRSYETETHLFVHGNYDEKLPLADQDDEVLLWRSLRQVIPGPHQSGKPVIVGHTAQKDGRVLDLGYLVCIDTGCCYGGRLTAMDVHRGVYWQVDKDGQLLAKPDA